LSFALGSAGVSPANNTFLPDAQSRDAVAILEV
jgi:hypothetical protein